MENPNLLIKLNGTFEIKCPNVQNHQKLLRKITLPIPLNLICYHKNHMASQDKFK